MGEVRGASAAMMLDMCNAGRCIEDMLGFSRQGCRRRGRDGGAGEWRAEAAEEDGDGGGGSGSKRWRRKGRGLISTLPPDIPDTEVLALPTHINIIPSFPF